MQSSLVSQSEQENLRKKLKKKLEKMQVEKTKSAINFFNT